MMQRVAWPVRFDPLSDRSSSEFRLIGRLADGVSVQQVAVSAIAARLDPLEPERSRPLCIEAQALRGWMPLRDLRWMMPLIALSWAVTALVLVVACANAANPLLARAGDGAGVFRRSRLQGALVALQVALSVALLSTGGSFVRELQATGDVDVVYDADRVLAVSFDLGTQRYDDEARPHFTRNYGNGSRGCRASSRSPCRRTRRWAGAARSSGVSIRRRARVSRKRRSGGWSRSA